MEEYTFTRLVDRLRSHEPALFPTRIWDEQLDGHIACFNPEDLARNSSKFDLTYGLSIKAGLHLWNESLDKSHTLSQDIYHPTGSYWHGIMHRMEGDYGNAKYWFDRVGTHPVFKTLHSEKSRHWAAREIEHLDNRELRMILRQMLLQQVWDPYLFVDAVQASVTSGREPKAERMLQAMQKHEILALMEYCYRRASGGLDH